MNTYIITEKQNTASQREGYKVELKDLSAAKRHASKQQAFHGTVLEMATGNGLVLAVKQNGKWSDK